MRPEVPQCGRCGGGRRGAVLLDDPRRRCPTRGGRHSIHRPGVDGNRRHSQSFTVPAHGFKASIISSAPVRARDTALRRMAATVIQRPRPRARCHASSGSSTVPRDAHGWRRTAATVTPATSSKSSLAVAGLERPAPRTRRSRWRATPGGRYGRMAPLSGRGLPSFTTRRHAVPAGRVRERVVPVAGHAERQPALPGASAELRATTDAGLRGGR